MRFDANGGLTADLTAREWEEEEEGENDCRAWNVLTVRNGCAIRQRERERENGARRQSMPCDGRESKAADGHHRHRHGDWEEESANRDSESEKGRKMTFSFVPVLRRMCVCMPAA